MDNTREKLIELIEQKYYCSIEELADHLIANGVTLDNQVAISKWIPVTERLPEDWALCACVDNEVHILGYDYIMDDWDIWGRPNTCYGKPFVTHWMQLPQPPKGE